MNKLNRLFAVAEPIDSNLALLIEDGQIGPLKDFKAQTRKKWESKDASKIWCFGPEMTGANILVDQTQGLAHLGDIRDSIQTGF